MKMYKIAYYIHQYQYNQTPAQLREDSTISAMEVPPRLFSP